MTSASLPLLTTAHVSTEPGGRGYSKMSTRRRERSQAPDIQVGVNLVRLENELATKVEEAPADSQNYVRQSGTWVVAPSAVTTWGTIAGTLSNQTDLYNALESKFDTWESGTAYYDGVTYLFVVYGVDGNWQATRATSTQTLSTAAGQAGTKPSTLTALRALTYS